MPMTRLSFWTPQLNALLASCVVAVGAWLAWDGLSPTGALLVAVCVAGWLLWRGQTIGRVWAWATFLLGLESFSWPVLTMVQINMATANPTEEQMGTILSAIVAGLLSAVFWVSFSYGLFKRDRGSANHSSPTLAVPPPPPPQSGKPRKRR